MIVVDKPAGLASVPVPGSSARSAAGELQATEPAARAVHRLDRETSGALVFALGRRAERELIEQFRRREVKKVYWALVRGLPRPAQGEIRQAITDRGKRAGLDPRGQPALTRYRVLERFATTTWMEARPVTGRYNQIRLHFVALGHPLIGERKYARGKESPVRFRRVALHARSVTLHTPAGGKEIRAKAPLPPDLEALLESLRSDRPPR